MYLSRKIGVTSQLVDVFVPDATVSTGAGLANIIASTVTLSWYRSDQAAVSTQTLTTGTLGTWAASTMTQASSSLALGWYQISLPNGVFATGSHAAALLYGAPSMAPVPITVDLSTMAIPSLGVSVSSLTLPVGVSSFAIAVGVSSFAIDVGVSSVSDKTGYALTTGERASIADKILGRNVSSGADGGRTVSEALYVLRNKVDATAGIVYATEERIWWRVYPCWTDDTSITGNGWRWA